MSLHGPYDPQNIFAKILRGEMPCVPVFEDQHILCIMDAFPQSKGHALVIPKNPSRNLLEVEPKNIGRLFGAAQRIARAVDKALSPDGIIVTQYSGAPAGQTVFHTHIHIIPKYEGGALQAHNSSQMADASDLEKTAKLIAANL